MRFFILCVLALAAPCAPAYTTSPWTPAQSMGTTRVGYAATLLTSGKVLIVGGHLTSTTIASAELYDPATNSWVEAPDFSSAEGERNGHTSTLLPSGKVLVVGGGHYNTTTKVRTYLATTRLYDPAANSWSAAGALQAARRNHTATLLRSGKVLVTGGFDAVGDVNSAELYDPQTNTWSPAGSIIARSFHTATLLASGKVLIAGGYSGNAELYDPSTNQWTPAGTMTQRVNATATLLTSGKVLVAGGYDGVGLDVVERYDPVTNAWASAHALTHARASHTATLLPSGQVLVAGGRYYNSNYTDITAAELYNPGSDTWSGAGSLAIARSNHIATLLPTGSVLVAGGENNSLSSVESSVEIYDPIFNRLGLVLPPGNGTAPDPRTGQTATLLASSAGAGDVVTIGGVSNGTTLASAKRYNPAVNQWADAGTMGSARACHSATLLMSGKVLVAGGIQNVQLGGPYLASAELFNPTGNAWSAAGALTLPRACHTATLLSSGKVLAVGGTFNGSVLEPDISELYDPAANAWTPAGIPAPSPRANHTATLLPSGKVLVVGGRSNVAAALKSVDVYDPVTNAWTAGPAMSEERKDHTATPLPSGKVLVVGGTGLNGVPLTHAELFDPQTNGWTAAASLTEARTDHSATLLPSGRVLVLAGNAGFTAELYDPVANAWQLLASLQFADHTATLLTLGGVLVVHGGAFEVLASDGVLDVVVARLPVFSLTRSTLSFAQAGTLDATATASNNNASTGAVIQTGFAPPIEASGGGSGSSASNVPVFQVQRVDSGQMRFIPIDGSIGFSDTQFAGSRGALSDFPGGPLLVRAWVNGAPSWARYGLLTEYCVVRDTIFCSNFE